MATASPTDSSMSSKDVEIGNERLSDHSDNPMILKSEHESTPIDNGEAISKEKTPTPQGIDPSSFPDGGWEAWSVVIGGFCCSFTSWGWINCVGVFQEYYQTHTLRNYSPSTVSWIISLELFMMMGFGPVYGKIYDNYGPRYILLVGTVLHVFGLMMASLSTEYYQFILSQGICSPIGASGIFYAAMSSIPSWFFRHRALALGVMASGSSLGGVVLPIMIQRLVDRAGFPWAMRAGAFMMLFMLIIANLTVKSRLPPSPRPFRFGDYLKPLKETPFLLLIMGTSIFVMGMFLPFNFLILQAESAGMNVKLAGYLLAILNGASVFGRVLPGHIGDLIGRFNVTVMMVYLSGIVTLAIWLPAKSNPPLIVFAALFGFGTGAYVSMVPALVAQISDIREIGVRVGTSFAFNSVAALISNPVGGALLTRQKGDYWLLQMYAGILMIVGSTLILGARVSLEGFRWAKIGFSVAVERDAALKHSSGPIISPSLSIILKAVEENTTLVHSVRQNVTSAFPVVCEEVGNNYAPETRLGRIQLHDFLLNFKFSGY